MSPGSGHDMPHPRLQIPPGARPPLNPSLSVFGPPVSSSYEVQITPAEFNSYSNEYISPGSPTTARPHSYYEGSSRPIGRASSVQTTGTGYMAFPEPQIYRSTSARSSIRSEYKPRHRISKSDTEHDSRGLPRHGDSSVSLASSYWPNDESNSYETQGEELSREMSNLSLDSEEGLRKFQAGELSERDEEWHRLVPAEAQDALGPKEVQRQSVLFEVFKSERDYVSDLEAVQEVFIEPLRNAEQPILDPSRVQGFISEVFWNLSRILAHHQRMLGALFDRQREQHPLVQSVADIVLDTTLLFRNEYESYIKHYPLAEALHRSELKSNVRYRSFIEECSVDPRIRKRDLITFLSRPVTRLPRLALVLEHVQKVTDTEHPDIEVLPIILSILSDFIKSTQPGIQAAESKVKFYDLCQSLVYMKGEIIDMDLYDESRSLMHSGPLARRQRSETDWSGWVDLNVALLDNYLLITKEETPPSGVVRRHVVSRPIPLEYLRLGVFNGSSESRKERGESILDSLLSHSKPLYPFTIYHASSKSSRRYTLFAPTESSRSKWHEALVDAIGLRKVRQEANMWFNPQAVSDRFFRVMGAKVLYGSGSRYTGKVLCAAPFSTGGRKFLVVACSNGVYVAPYGDANYHKVLPHANAASIYALEKYNKIIIHCDSSIYTYSLDLLARAAQEVTPHKTLEATLERLAPQDTVVLVRVGRVGQRTIIAYISKSFLQLTLTVLEVIVPSETTLISARRSSGSLSSFRLFGGPFNVPKDTSDMTPLVKKLAVSTERNIIVLDPTNLAKSVITTVPDLTQASANLPMANLKSRLDGAKPLGLVRCEGSELLAVYDDLGCYITKHGVPSRSSGYIRWETKATSFAPRGAHILLFSPEFIEIRNTKNGRLVQVIEGRDVRLIHCGPTTFTDDIILAAMRGSVDDKDGVSEKIVELVETSEIHASAPPNEAIWDEWDM